MEKITVRLLDLPSWMQGYSCDEIRSAQQKDQNLRVVINWLEHGQNQEMIYFV
jgi:hypothetical protein